MSNEKPNLNEIAGNILWAVIFAFGVLSVWHYVRQVMKKEEMKDYEAIIAEKDKIIERQQIMINRQNKLLKNDSAAKKKLE